MSHLAVILFNGFRVELDGKPLNVFKTDKNRALLAYLVLESEQPHRREALANLLWPEHPESVARNSLRQALYQLRRILPPEAEKEPHLFITPDQVQFNPASDHCIDVLAFKQLLSACLSHHPSDNHLCTDCLENLSRAIQLYQGDLLAGFTLPHCATFTDWQIINQEAYHRLAMAALARMAEYFEANQAYDPLIACAEKKIELEPWHESAYRHQMWALAMTGRREQALQRYRSLQEVLQRELGVPPTEGITRLYEQIRDGELPGSRAMQGDRSTSSPSASHLPAAGIPIIVGRQSELAQLNCYLRDSLAGLGRVAFVSGEAGSGKSALMSEFARQAMHAHTGLLVAGGTCSAMRGLGDSFQPFRELLESLFGVSAAPYSWGKGSLEFDRRLKAARPVLLHTLLETSPDLIGILLPVQDLLQQARKTGEVESAMVARLEILAAHLDAGPKTASRPNAIIQASLYDQVARLLQAISHHSPLLILLDDMQWLDNESVSLLFHLGNHLHGGRILLLGAYRPEDLAVPPVSTAQAASRHPFLIVLNEFKRRFGEIQINLSEADGRAFVNAYLDSQPNRLDENFRELLYRYTGGNALFTVELFRAMQAGSEVTQDNSGHWIQELPIDWERLPVRVEAVISEHLSRLDRECRTLLEAASVQGEIFSADVLARMLGTNVDAITTHLSGSLCKQHLLVDGLGMVAKDGCHQACYRFRSLLLQVYLFQSLDDVEQQRLRWAGGVSAPTDRD